MLTEVSQMQRDNYRATNHAAFGQTPARLLGTVIHLLVLLTAVPPSQQFGPGNHDVGNWN